MLRSEFDWCSTASVYLELLQWDEFVAHGSGFIVRGTRVYEDLQIVALEQPYLITARHCVTGRDSKGRFVGKSGAWPTRVRIWWYQKAGWSSFEEELITGPEQPAWLEHPELGDSVDVVALPVRLPDEFQAVYDPYGVERTPIAWGIASELKVIGFPYELTNVRGVPVWTRGTVATEPTVDHYAGQPTFLIDSRTPPGQSGSPVVLWSDGTSFPDDSGRLSQSTSGPISCLVGVYSGRVDNESDLGIVWKIEVIKQIIRAHGPTSEQLQVRLEESTRRAVTASDPPAE